MAEFLDVFEDGGDEGFDDGLAFFACGQRGIAPRSGGGIGASALGIAGETAGLIGIEIAHGLFHANGFRLDVEHHGGFDFVGVRASGLAKFFLDWIVFGEIGVMEDYAVFCEVGCGLCERPECGDAGVEDVKAARAVVRERMNDVGDHGAGGIHAERSGARIFEEGGVVTVVDGGSDNGVLRGGIEYTFLEIFSHEEIVVELEMAAMLFGFGAESDNDDRVGRENVLGFIPRERFEKFGRVGVLDGRRRDGGRLSRRQSRDR